MTVLLCWVMGALFSISIYLILSRQLMRWLFGIVILSSTINLGILVVGRLNNTRAAFVPKGVTLFLEASSNPLPQALILTSIVIGFGLLAFALVLVRKVWERFDTLNSDELRLSEPVSSGKSHRDIHS